MEWITYVAAAAAIVVLIVVGIIGSGLWIGCWRQRRWHDGE